MYVRTTPRPMLAAALLVVTLGGCATSESSRSEPTQDRETEQRPSTSGVDETSSTRPTIVAHRGAPAHKPENTLPSFEVALDARADIVELDLHLSKEGRLVVWHDPFLRKSKCRPPASGGEEAGASSELPSPAGPEKTPERARVRNLTASQLRSYDCSRNPAPEEFPEQDAEPTRLAGDDYGIVTLDEFFDFVEHYAASEVKSRRQRRNARRVEFFLEIKRHPEHPSYIDDGFDGSGPAAMERKFVEIVRSRDLVDRTIVQGFTRASLWAVHGLESSLRLSVAEAQRRDPLASYAEKGASYWSPNADLVSAESLGEAHDAGLRVAPWTVNDPGAIERLTRLGVDAIITDDPARAAEATAPCNDPKDGCDESR